MFNYLASDLPATCQRPSYDLQRASNWSILNQTICKASLFSIYSVILKQTLKKKDATTTRKKRGEGTRTSAKTSTLLSWMMLDLLFLVRPNSCLLAIHILTQYLRRLLHFFLIMYNNKSTFLFWWFRRAICNCLNDKSWPAAIIKIFRSRLEQDLILRTKFVYCRDKNTFNINRSLRSLSRRYTHAKGR